MPCPKCGSDEWRLASFVHKDGQSTINTTTSAGGFNFSAHGVGYGAGRAKTTGTLQTELSKEATPPGGYFLTRVMLAIFIVTAIFGYFNFSGAERDITSGAICFAIAAASLFGLYYIFPKDRAKYQRAMARYERTRLCMRCGEFYIAHQ